MAGLQPQVRHNLTSYKDAIYLESVSPLYTNVFVVRMDKKQDPQIAKLIAAFQSPQVAAVARTVYYGSAIKAW